MYRIEMHSTIRRIIAIFYVFGYWHNVLTVRRVARTLFHLLSIVLFHSLIVTCAWASDDKSESLFLVQVEISAIVMTVKLIYILRNRDTILSFLGDTIVSHCIADYMVFVQVEKKIKNFIKCVHVYLAIVALIVFVLIITPLPMFSHHKQLPMFIVYSLDWKYSELIYWTVYSPLALQIFLTFVINLLTVIIWYVMLNCSIKYQLLGYQLKNMGNTKPTTVQNDSLLELDIFKQELDLYRQDLVNFIENHQKLFEMVERFRSDFSNIFIAQIVTSCVSICSSNYILIHSYHNDFLQMIAFLLTFLYGVVNIFVLMYLGNAIQFESNKLSYCLFESNWIDQSKSTRKCVLIMGEMLQRPHELVLCKLFPMNFLTFTAVVNFAIILCNVLRNVC